jgi:hypothetical protein
MACGKDERTENYGIVRRRAEIGLPSGVAQKFGEKRAHTIYLTFFGES